MKTKTISKLMLMVLLFMPLLTFSQSTIYVDPNGSSSNPGTASSPTTLEQAVTLLSSGGTIYMQGGTYNYSSSIVITANGASGALKKVFAQNGTPVINFSAMSEDSSNRGIVLDGDYWHFKGIIIEEAGDNGMLLSGNNNTIEDCIFRKNHDTGLQLSRYNSSAASISEWPSDNLILNCEAYDNQDSNNEDADGFAAKLTCGTGNIFRGCVSHHNIDDGWDLYTKSDTGPIGPVLFEDCIAHHNGSLTSGGTSGEGDKNGFKLGSSSNLVNHILRRCIAYQNGKHGFTDNGNISSIEFSNNTSYDNDGYNFHTRDDASHVFKNNVSFGNSQNDRIRGDASAPNSFVGATGGFTVDSSDFVTLSQGSNSDPTSNGFLNLVSGSDLIDAGVTTSGISYSGSSPDLGAIEYGGSGSSNPDISLSASAGNGSVSLSWTVTDITPATLSVYRDTDSDPSGRTRIDILATSATSYTDDTVSNGTTYYYWIKISDSNGDIYNSNAASATPSSGSSSTVTRIEDTDSGTVSYDGSLKSYSDADNGTAINLSNSSGQEIVWSYSASSSGTFQLTFRYTRKASMNTSVDIDVNGSSQTLSLPETASSTFSTVSMSASLNSGSNSIILRTNASGESADIDWIEISGSTSRILGKNGDSNLEASVTDLETLQNDKLEIYPVPAYHTITIKSPTEVNGKIMLFNIMGQLMHLENYTVSKQTVDISALKHGVYFLKVFTGDREITRRIIKK